MYLPLTSYTGESIKSEVAEGEITEGTLMTTAVAIPGQLHLPSLDNCSCHVCTTVVAIHGQLRLPSMDNCSCHVRSNVIEMYKHSWMESVNKYVWHGWSTTHAMLNKLHLPCSNQLLP